MSETDALSTFDFSKVTGSGLFVKFTPGEALTLRILTVDPVVTNESYEDKRTGEPIVGTKFSFVVYNWTEGKAQILKATPKTAKSIGELHRDPDFGANIRKVDLKITAPNKGEIKAYEIQVLPQAKELTNEQIKQCAAIKLEEHVEGDRMSFYEPPVPAAAKSLGDEFRSRQGDKEEDVVDEDIGDEPINLNDIPF